MFNTAAEVYESLIPQMLLCERDSWIVTGHRKGWLWSRFFVDKSDNKKNPVLQYIHFYRNGLNPYFPEELAGINRNSNDSWWLSIPFGQRLKPQNTSANMGFINLAPMQFQSFLVKPSSLL